MKQICTQIAFVCALLITTKSFSQNVAQNFESQTEVNTLIGQCWTFNNVGFTSSSVISGSGSVVTQLGSQSEMITPELLIPPSLAINFSYNTIATSTGSKTLKVLLVINGVETLLQSINLNSNPSASFSGTFTSANTPGNNINGSRKVIFRTSDNASVVIDNLTISAPYTYTTGCAVANSPLPVTFAGFSAKKTTSGISLTWAVGTEMEVNRYEVQKSSDGKNFKTIGSVAANNTPSYNYIDGTIADIVYYRIKSVDNDGKYAYSTVVSVKGQQSTVVLKAFPIPAQNQLTIQHGAAGNSSKIEIVAADGRMITSVSVASGTQQTNIDMSIAKPGVYVIRFVDNANTETLKIVKQ
jgi:hypothetical protein